MLGAIIGDIVGSTYEFQNTRDYNFELFPARSSYTDDTICTIAVADAIMSGISFKESLLNWCKQYPHPMGGYGGSFARWICASNPQPYDSFGNGAAMRVSPCALLADGNREKALSLAAQSAMPTHNHPEAVKGAMAVTDAILLAFDHLDKELIRGRLSELYGYNLFFNCDEIRDTNTFNETCMVTVPQAIVAFLDSKCFEDAIRNAVSIGGDSDTIAAICGAIAEAYYGIPANIKNKALGMLPAPLANVVYEMYNLSKI